MTLIKCKQCGHKISDKALKCPKCDTFLSQEKKCIEEEVSMIKESHTKNCIPKFIFTPINKNNKLLILACSLVSIALVFGVIYFCIKSNSIDIGMEKTRDVVEIDESISVVKSYLITNNGTDEVQLGMNIANFIPNTSIDGIKSKSQHSFYSHVEIKNVGISDYERGYFLYNENQLVMILTTTYDDEPNAKIRQIKLYSDVFCPTGFENIKVGFPLKKLVNDYNAKVRLAAGPEMADLTVKIPGMEENIIIVGNTDDVKDWNIYSKNEEGFVDTDVNLSNLKDDAAISYIMIENPSEM